jgi:hypothetical protein
MAFPYSNSIEQNQAVVSANNNSTEVISNNVVTNEGTTVIHHQPIQNSQMEELKVAIIQKVTPETIVIAVWDDQKTRLFNWKPKAAKLYFQYVDTLVNNSGKQLHKPEVIEMIINKVLTNLGVEKLKGLNSVFIEKKWKEYGLPNFKERDVRIEAANRKYNKLTAVDAIEEEDVEF